MFGEEMNAILERLERIERLIVEQKSVKEWYATEEFARLVGKAEFTVREWCRLGRVRCRKRNDGHGKHRAWVIPHEELLRIQREGLLPGKPKIAPGRPGAGGPGRGGPGGGRSFGGGGGGGFGGGGGGGFGSRPPR